MIQGDLFDVIESRHIAAPAMPPHNGTPTSRAAAESMKGHACDDRRRILHAFLKAGADGLTCDEIEARLGMSHQSASARVWELKDPKKSPEGIIVGTGRKRKTRSGRAAEVWVAEEFAEGQAND